MKITLKSKAFKRINLEFIQEVLAIIREVDLANLYGRMVSIFKENGLMVRKMVMGFGDLLKMIFMRVNGLIISKMERDIISTKVDPNIRDILTNF